MNGNGRLRPEELQTVDGWANLTPATARAYNAAKSYILQHFGIPLIISDPYGAYRSIVDQISVKAIYHGLAATPGYSNHGLGIAFDMNNITTVSRAVGGQAALDAIMARFGFVRDAGNGAGGIEQWHYTLRAIVNLSALEGAIELQEPIPEPPKEQEEEMKKSGFICKLASGVTICLVLDTGSGWATEWQDAGGAYNTAVGKSLGVTEDFAPISESHLGNLRASCAAVRPK